MKLVSILMLSLMLTACNSGSASKSAEDSPATNHPALLDMSDVVVTQIDFSTPLNPTYDTFQEIQFKLKNVGIGDGNTYIHIAGAFGDPGNFEITSSDPKCLGDEPLLVGETCLLKLVFRYIPGVTPDGVKTAKIILWNADDPVEEILVNAEVRTM